MTHLHFGRSHHWLKLCFNFQYQYTAAALYLNQLVSWVLIELLFQIHRNRFRSLHTLNTSGLIISMPRSAMTRGHQVQDVHTNMSDVLEKFGTCKLNSNSDFFLETMNSQWLQSFCYFIMVFFVEPVLCSLWERCII